MFHELLLATALSYDPVSAHRDERIPYVIYEQRAMKAIGESGEKEIAARSALGRATRFNEEALPHPTHWKSYDQMMARFKEIRDARFLVWRRKPEVLRRSSWKYPDDGCYARAALANRNLFRWYHPVPNKVFVFGHLRVKTSNSPRGAVGWWYHVAPIVEVGNVKYVLDPAIEPANPLPLRDWLARMGTPEKMKVSICGSGTYSPGDSCDKETDGMEMRAERAQQSYLDREYERLVRLGRENEV